MSTASCHIFSCVEVCVLATASAHFLTFGKTSKYFVILLSLQLLNPVAISFHLLYLKFPGGDYLWPI